MRIHIKSPDPRVAATELRAMFQRFPGSWVVHGYAQEGYVAGRLGTREGDALLRYGCEESEAGVYDTGRLPSVTQMADELRAASAEYRRMYGEGHDRDRPLLDRRGSSKDTRFIPLTDIAEKVLKDTGHHTVMSLAAHLQASRSATTDAVKKLLDAKRIKVVNMLPSASPRGGVPVRVFGVAA